MPYIQSHINALHTISLGKKKPVLVETTLGWLVAGSIHTQNSKQKQPYTVHCNLINNIELDAKLDKFFELESVPSTQQIHTKGESECERIFTQTTTRHPDGKFVVTVPLKESPECLGDSKTQALLRFQALERKFKRNPEFKQKYIEFIDEYLRLGHMSENTDIHTNETSYFLPHHAICRESSLTSRLRTVFDGSAVSSSGKSFNDIQYVGPTVQDDLLSILIRFRQHKFVVTSDVQKMYRQIYVTESQRSLQQILWRSDTSQPIKQYKLNTVTYGTSSAPYLATRCLVQLGQECAEKNVSETILHDFYVDDYISGNDDKATLLETCRGVIKTLESAHFHLRKWRSNTPSLLDNLVAENSSDELFKLDTENHSKTLGLLWSCQSDELLFSVAENLKPKPTTLNPADIGSRGQSASNLKNSLLWWEGPPFLHETEIQWPTQPQNLPLENLPEVKIQCFVSTEQCEDNFTSKYSNFCKLQRIIAYMNRFVHNCKNITNKNTGPLKVSELNLSLQMLCKQVQTDKFSEQLSRLLNKRPLSHKDILLKFNPFVDTFGIMRVGGRLASSYYDYNTKHPILLHASHHITKILVHHYHRMLMHTGPQLMLATLRHRYWIINGRNLCRQTSQSCITCLRYSGKTHQPIMGNLPLQRVQSEYVFANTSCDYAGPILIASRKGRGCQMKKAYIVVFVCLAVRAVHLELVTDLTAMGFIAALNRFIARRGKPATILSDNGTCFIGASNELAKFLKNNSEEITSYSATKEIEFKFCPAYSPHFNGLAEGAVKQVKHHLKRVTSMAHLDYEEMVTFLVQVEALLNSRPLTPISSDPSDLTPLTPAHFLIGRTLTMIPAPLVQDSPIHTLTRYQRIEALKAHFWNRYYKEFISELQVRNKWRRDGGQLKLGEMVLVKDDRLPPSRWLLGRVTAVYPGNDGVSRVADVTTTTGTLRRAYNRLCPLPLTLDQDGPRGPAC